ncbi:uncharacterized protein UV8b_07777 [Ustilaginoidea virens]|uniref:Uncharacterized protein n=1 Tax=Ustilaginoidea virens TaxID=1159556 RepID=A0A063BSI5_USTVR|nr:uncharacterized protein UV8b_07777 [Ustilaginoidea virens]QUC23536.1 hypothetical protein UV8b_07777 [Ustilaginoidea virens]GAO15889.1 hypothetical protein UVI_02051310 [Ustilaginoidea virens]
MPQPEIVRHHSSCPSPQAAQSANVRNAQHQEPLATHSTHDPAVGDSDTHLPRPSFADQDAYSIPDTYLNLNELAASRPVDDADDGSIHGHASLDRTRSLQQQQQQQQQQHSPLDASPPADERPGQEPASRALTQLYTVSYLVFFALAGTLARVGLAALTHYADTPVIFTTIWANFGGSLVMGFLAEDRKLFRHEWAAHVDRHAGGNARKSDQEEACAPPPAADCAAAKQAHLAFKKTMPLYIGLATGFCGSFTSFSSFMRDLFLAMSDDLVAPGFGTRPEESRSGGYSFMAMVAVVVTTLALSLSGLAFGAHCAAAAERFVPSVPRRWCRRALDPLAVALGWGCWLGAVLMAVFPPDDSWRGKVVYALVFAPPGCLARFCLALALNGKLATFPLGTFAANVLGTAVLGMAWDMAHLPIGGVVGCQVLQGVEDGFCGCLTTVSTWVAELSSLRRRSAYLYGATSVVVSWAALVLIMGGLRWTEGWSALKC